jgi:hypothetical protein
MQIIQQTHNQLTLRLRPVGSWIMGGIFTLVSLVVASFFGQTNTLTCERSAGIQGQCHLKSSGLLGSRIRHRWPLDEIQGAQVVQSSREDSSTYQVQIMTQSDTVGLAPYYSSGRGAKVAIAQEIEAFLASPEQPELTVRQNEGMAVFIFAGIVGLLGIGLISTPVVICDLNKPLDRLTLKRRGLLTRSSKDYRIREICDVIVDESQGRKSTQYRVWLIMQSGERVRVKDNSGSRYSNQHTADTIRQFLNLTLPAGSPDHSTVSPGDVGMLLKQAIQFKFTGE